MSGMTDLIRGSLVMALQKKMVSKPKYLYFFTKKDHAGIAQRLFNGA